MNAAAVPFRPRVSAPLAVMAALLFAGLLFWQTRLASVETERRSPDHASMHYYLGKCRLLTGSPEQAVAAFQRAVACNPESFAAHAGLGNALTILGRRDEAEASYRAALERQPDDAESLTNLANLLLARGSVAEACAFYRTVLAKEPDEVSVLNNLAWILATSIEDVVRDGAEAVTLAERARQTEQGRHPVLGLTLAAAYAEAGRFEDAIRTAEDSLRQAESAGNAALMESARTHLQAYRAGKAIRVTP